MFWIDLPEADKKNWTVFDHENVSYRLQKFLGVQQDVAVEEDLENAMARDKRAGSPDPSISKNKKPASTMDEYNKKKVEKAGEAEEGAAAEANAASKDLGSSTVTPTAVPLMPHFVKEPTKSEPAAGVKHAEPTAQQEVGIADSATAANTTLAKDTLRPEAEKTIPESASATRVNLGLLEIALPAPETAAKTYSWKTVVKTSRPASSSQAQLQASFEQKNPTASVADWISAAPERNPNASSYESLPLDEDCP